MMTTTEEEGANAGSERIFVGQSNKGDEYTVEQAIDYIGFGKFQMVFLVVTGLSWLCDAMEMMLLSFIGPAARCEWRLTTTQASSLTSFVFLGMGFGAPIFGMFADRKGRLFSLRCSTGLTLLAGVGSALAPTFSALCFATPEFQSKLLDSLTGSFLFIVVKLFSINQPPGP